MQTRTAQPDSPHAAPAAAISVALCTYNGARFLAEQLASLAGQSRLPAELVVCDDRSTDATLDILAEFAKTAPFPVRFHCNEANLGSTKNFERALGLCRGDLIALCDQDDRWDPAKLARLAAVLDAEPAAGAVFSNAALISAEGERVSGTLWGNVGFSADEQKAFEIDPTFFLIRRPLVTGATLMFRASFAEQIVPISTEWVHDEWIALVISAIAKLRPVHEQLIEYRLHEDQQIGLRRVAVSTALRMTQEQRAGFHYRVGRKLSAMAAKLAVFPGTAKSVSYASDKARYMRRRANLLSGPWLPRVPFGVTLMRGHLRYGNGLVSYLRDLLHG